MLVEAVCNENDVTEGEMKQFAIGPGKVLLTKHNGTISAVGAKCTHYGAPLATGSYSNGKVRCPWHGACFSTVTGDIEDFPGVDSLYKYEVNIKDGLVYVSADEDSLKNFRRVKNMVSCVHGRETFLIIGGGSAALLCAETLRQEGFDGSLVMAAPEIHPPYDRPKLSKMMQAEASTLYLRDDVFLKEKDIVRLQKRAVSVDTSKRIVTFSDNSTHTYDKLFVGTGGSPRVLDVPGAQLENVCYLRSPEDANHLHNICKDKDVVVIGTGFIGMEVTAYLKSKSIAKSVTVVGSGRQKIPFERVLGAKIGNLFFQLHKDKGVKFFMDSGVGELQGVDGKVSNCVLKDGTNIPADVVVAGIGVVPSTDFLQMTDLKFDKSGNLVVDEYMCAGKNVYGGGDIVSFPYWYDNGNHVNIGHWQTASAHGRCAALNMLGKVTPLRTVPFFWTMMFGKTVRYAGHCTSFDDIIYEGDVDAMKFVAYFCRENKVHAVASMNMGSITMDYQIKMQEGTCPNANELKC